MRAGFRLPSALRIARRGGMMSAMAGHPTQVDPSGDVDAPDAARGAGLVDWLFTLPFLTAFGAVLLFFDPLQRLARLSGARPHEIVVGMLQVSITAALRLCGTRIGVERSPELESHRGYLLIANHQSMLDIPIVAAKLFTNYPKYVSKRSLASWLPSISYNLRRGGNAVIDRDDRGQAVAAIRELGEYAQARNVSVVIYPEGTRSRGGQLRPFKPAGARALLEAAPTLPVVPVTIDESWRLLRHNFFPVPFGVRVRVRLGAPIDRDEAKGLAILERAEHEIADTLARWRSDP